MEYRQQISKIGLSEGYPNIDVIVNTANIKRICYNPYKMLEIRRRQPLPHPTILPGLVDLSSYSSLPAERFTNAGAEISAPFLNLAGQIAGMSKYRLNMVGLQAGRRLSDLSVKESLGNRFAILHGILVDRIKSDLQIPYPGNYSVLYILRGHLEGLVRQNVMRFDPAGSLFQKPENIGWFASGKAYEDLSGIPLDKQQFDIFRHLF